MNGLISIKLLQGILSSDNVKCNNKSIFFFLRNKLTGEKNNFQSIVQSFGQDFSITLSLKASYESQSATIN